MQYNQNISIRKDFNIFSKIKIKLWIFEFICCIHLNVFKAVFNSFLKVVKMLVWIVILFILCWFPIHIFNIIVWFSPPKLKTDTHHMIYVFTYFFCHFLSMSHSFINPFVYGFMSENFKVLESELYFWTRIWLT